MFEEIMTEYKNLAGNIRKYSQSQAAYWQTIPWFAVHADGRTGYSQQLATAYQYGRWILPWPSGTNKPEISIDLANGNFVYRDRTPVEQDYMLLHLAHDIDSISAAKVINDLINEGQKPYPSYYTPSVQEAWREQMILRHRVQHIFSRQQSSAA